MPPKLSKNVPLYLRNLQKNLVHGTLIEAEILTSPHPHVFTQLSPVLGAGTLHGCINTFQVVQKCSYVPQEPPKNVVHEALIEAAILTSSLPRICSTWTSCWVPALCPWVCQHLQGDLKMFLCVSGTSKKNLVYGAIIEAEILTSQLPHVFAQLSPVLGTGTLPTGVSTPPKWSKMFLCVSGTSQKNLVYGPLIEAEILTSPPPYICSTWTSCWHQASAHGYVNTSQVV